MALVRGRAAERVLKWGAERERVSIRMLGYPASRASSPVSLICDIRVPYKWLEMH